MKKIIIMLGFLGIMSGSATSVFAGYFNTTPIDRCDTQITRTLQVGSQNNDVLVLQNMLKQGGYLYVEPNGYFGPSTKAAVKRFQIENGVSANGIVGELTRNAVNERLCDVEVRGDTTSNYYDYNFYGYTSGTTYVTGVDPYVKVISPTDNIPAVYTTPQENMSSFSQPLVSNQVIQAFPPVGNTLSSSLYLPQNVILPATSQITGTHIVNNPSIGYTYGITQNSGSLTVITPRVNSVFNEGDTLNLSFTTSNLNATAFQVFLENTSTGKSVNITTIKNTSTSFVLSKELLDAVCLGACNASNQGSFKIVISTPVTDIASVTTNFRAAVSPITIRRPYAVTAAISLSTSKSPIDSGEKFRVYVSVPLVTTDGYASASDTSVKIRALCLNGVQVSIGGVPCGQDLVMPSSILTSQQGIPVTATNTTWYKQDVTFEASVMTLSGQVLGTAKTVVTVNPAPFSW